ncbi:MAG: DedA family protein [Candidatus Micrarchaeia archaeon]
MDVIKKNKVLLESLAAGLVLVIISIAAINFIETSFPDGFEQIQRFTLQYGLFGVFIVVFLGSTILPFPTDLFYLAIAKTSRQSTEMLAAIFTVSVLAGVIAGLVNYYIAFFFREKIVEKFASKKELDAAKSFLDSYGPFALVVFGLAPSSFAEDPLTFVCGLGAMNVKKFLFYNTLGRVVNMGTLTASAAYF